MFVCLLEHGACPFGSFLIYFILVWFKNNFFWVFRRKTRWMNMISYMLYNMNFIARDYSFDPGLTTPTFFLGILLTSPIVFGPMFAIHKTCLIKNLRIAMVICSELCHFKLIWKNRFEFECGEKGFVNRLLKRTQWYETF